MNTRRMLSTVLLLFSLPTFRAYTQTIPEQLLHSCQLSFTLPSGFTLLDGRRVGELSFDFGISSSAKKLEIRFLLSKAKPFGGPGMPEKNYSFILPVLGVVISGGNKPQIVPFSPEDSQIRFKADAGATTLLDCKSKFGEGYEHCMLVTFERSGVAVATACYLFDDYAVLAAALMSRSIVCALVFN
jgi:hypothetical protein